MLHDLNAIPGALIPVGDRTAHFERSEFDKAAAAASPEMLVLKCVQDASEAYVRSHQRLPDTATHSAALKAMKDKCRADNGLPPANSGE